VQTTFWGVLDQSFSDLQGLNGIEVKAWLMPVFHKLRAGSGKHLQPTLES